MGKQAPVWTPSSTTAAYRTRQIGRLKPPVMRHTINTLRALCIMEPLRATIRSADSDCSLRDTRFHARNGTFLSPAYNHQDERYGEIRGDVRILQHDLTATIQELGLRKTQRATTQRLLHRLRTPTNVTSSLHQSVLRTTRILSQPTPPLLPEPALAARIMIAPLIQRAFAFTTKDLGQQELEPDT